MLLIRHKFVDAVAGGTGEGDHSKWSGLKRSLSRAKMSVRIRLRKKVIQNDFDYKTLKYNVVEKNKRMELSESGYGKISYPR